MAGSLLLKHKTSTECSCMAKKKRGGDVFGIHLPFYVVLSELMLHFKQFINSRIVLEKFSPIGHTFSEEVLHILSSN